MTTGIDDERALVAAAQADPARFIDLYDRYVDRVYAFVSTRSGNRATAEDVTSQVFEQALAHLGRFEWRGVTFGAWLLRIASNVLADQWRQDARESHEIPRDAGDPRDAENLDRRLVLFQLIDRLPEMQRQVVRMRFGEDRSIREIAGSLGRSEGAVKQLQLRALENLRKGLAPHD